MASVQLDRIGKTYVEGGVPTVHEVSLDIAEGEFCVFVGPSGCGKSTLLRMIAGLDTITSGELRIGGRRVNELAPGERDVAMVFQSYALYPHLDVADNLGFGLRLARVPKLEARKRIEEVARLLQIEHLLQRKPRELSGGQRQRVAIGRAWCVSRGSSCLTSRCRTWMRRCASRPAWRLPGCTAARAAPARST